MIGDRPQVQLRPQQHGPFAQHLDLDVHRTSFIPDINNPSSPCCSRASPAWPMSGAYHVLLFNTAENTDASIRSCRPCASTACAALHHHAVSEQDPDTMKRLHNFETLGIPVVLLDREVDSQFFDRVVTADDARRVCGRQRADPRRSPPHRHHHRSRGLAPRPRAPARLLPRRCASMACPSHRLISARATSWSDCAYEQTLALCAMQEPPTAVFSSNNYDDLRVPQGVQ